MSPPEAVAAWARRPGRDSPARAPSSRRLDSRRVAACCPAMTEVADGDDRAHRSVAADIPPRSSSQLAAGGHPQPPRCAGAASSRVCKHGVAAAALLSCRRRVRWAGAEPEPRVLQSVQGVAATSANPSETRRGAAGVKSCNSDRTHRLPGAGVAAGWSHVSMRLPITLAVPPPDYEPPAVVHRCAFSNQLGERS